MMMGMHTAIAVSLIALALGTFLLLWTCKAELCCKMFGKIIGIVIITMSILSILCSIYNGIAMRRMGQGCMGMSCMQEMSNPMHGFDTDKMGGRPRMKKDCPMMKMMMEEPEHDND